MHISLGSVKVMVLISATSPPTMPLSVGSAAKAAVPVRIEAPTNRVEAIRVLRKDVDSMVRLLKGDEVS